MNTPNITNYKPKDFAELKQIERDEDIVKELQDGNKSVKGTDSQNQ